MCECVSEEMGKGPVPFKNEAKIVKRQFFMRQKKGSGTREIGVTQRWKFALSCNECTDAYGIISMKAILLSCIWYLPGTLAVLVPCVNPIAHSPPGKHQGAQ